VTQLYDAYGNVVTRAGVLVTLHMAAGTLFGLTAAYTNASGQAVFYPLISFTPGINYLIATAGGIGSFASPPFFVFSSPFTAG
jgi:hypothetical protein